MGFEIAPNDTKRNASSMMQTDHQLTHFSPVLHFIWKPVIWFDHATHGMKRVKDTWLAIILDLLQLPLNQCAWQHKLFQMKGKTLNMRWNFFTSFQRKRYALLYFMLVWYNMYFLINTCLFWWSLWSEVSKHFTVKKEKVAKATRCEWNVLVVFKQMYISVTNVCFCSYLDCPWYFLQVIFRW